MPEIGTSQRQQLLHHGNGALRFQQDMAKRLAILFVSCRSAQGVFSDRSYTPDGSTHLERSIGVELDGLCMCCFQLLKGLFSGRERSAGEPVRQTPRDEEQQGRY